MKWVFLSGAGSQKRGSDFRELCLTQTNHCVPTIKSEKQRRVEEVEEKEMWMKVTCKCTLDESQCSVIHVFWN